MFSSILCFLETGSASMVCVVGLILPKLCVGVFIFLPPLCFPFSILIKFGILTNLAVCQIFSTSIYMSLEVQAIFLWFLIPPDSPSTHSALIHSPYSRTELQEDEMVIGILTQYK